MEDQEKKDRIFSYAVENFKNGLNCAECVYDALIRAGVLEVAPETRAMCTAFGGGIGLSGYTCGALSGAVMANSAIYGRPDPWSVPDEERGHEVAAKYYRRYNKMVHDFEAANGGVLCREICSKYDDWHSKDRKKACLKLIGAAAVMAYEYLQMPQEEAFKLPYGENMGEME